MQILPFDNLPPDAVPQATALLAANFACWADPQTARAELESCQGPEMILLAAWEAGEVVGLIGGRPEYDGHVWELHPLVVREDCRGRGIGRRLVAALEAAVMQRGGITLYLGTDDEEGGTSLSGVDLYDGLYARLAGIRNLNRHPYEFYQRCGYRIVGVVPDANGPGKPDIMMAKRVGGGRSEPNAKEDRKEEYQ